MPNPTRDEAFALLRQYNHADKAIKHALAVEAVMRYMAGKRGQDPEKWGVIGLVHDLDYEQFPDQHCTKTREILASLNWPDDYIHSIISHGWGLCSDIEPTSEMEKVLFAIDELTGLVAAVTLVRPSKALRDVEIKSVRKKWKERGFAAGVNRQVIEQGAQMLAVPVDELIADVIAGMLPAADQIGLAGSPPPASSAPASPQ